MCKNYLLVLTAPAKALAKKDEGTVIGVLVISSALLALAAFIAMYSLLPIIGISVVIALFAFLCVIVCAAVGGLLIKIAANVLGGRGALLAGLTSVSYSLFAPSIGIFLASILFQLTLVGKMVAVLVLAVSFVLGFATFYRAVKELFRLDWVPAFIAVSVLIAAVVLAVYVTVGAAAMGKLMSTYLAAI